MSILNEQGGALLREKLDAVSRNRQLDNAIRLEDARREAEHRQAHSLERHNGVADAAARVQLELSDINEKRLEGSGRRADERLREQASRSSEVQALLGAAHEKRVAEAAISAERRAGERQATRAQTAAILERGGALLLQYAAERATLRADLAAFSAQMQRRDGQLNAGALARSITHTPARAINPRAVARQAREAARRGDAPSPAQTPGVPTSGVREGALNTAPVGRSPVERRRESIVRKLVTNRPGATLPDLVEGLQLEQAEVTAILKRLVAEGRLALRDGGYHALEAAEKSGS